MLITPKNYLDAAGERLDQARTGYNQGRHGQAIWIAGVAIECCLRAYRTRHDPEFDARHDLKALFKQSGLLEIAARDFERRKVMAAGSLAGLVELRAAIHAAASIWHNNHRYASAARIRAQLGSAQLHRGVKRDWLKARALEILGCAALIVEEGRRLWGLSAGK